MSKRAFSEHDDLFQSMGGHGQGVGMGARNHGGWGGGKSGEGTHTSDLPGSGSESPVFGHELAAMNSWSKVLTPYRTLTNLNKCSASSRDTGWWPGHLSFQALSLYIVPHHPHASELRAESQGCWQRGLDTTSNERGCSAYMLFITFAVY